jgi:hypothetical protein
MSIHTVQLLSLYNQDCRFLVDFKTIEGKGVGFFNIKSDFYCNTDRQVYYFTAVELQICLNQLMYEYFAHLGYITTTNESEYVYNLITAQEFSFKQLISTEKIIVGEISITTIKHIKNARFICCSFNFEESCHGTVKVILRN